MRIVSASSVIPRARTCVLQLYVKGSFVGGHDIVEEMHSNGELAPMLAEATKIGRA